VFVVRRRRAAPPGSPGGDDRDTEPATGTAPREAW
jgi:hypothetical protein